jgi:hypothetical protein
MDKQQTLEMWWSLFCSLRSIPNSYRSQNHTALINEVSVNIYDLVNELDLDHRLWNTDNLDFLPFTIPNP